MVELKTAEKLCRKNCRSLITIVFLTFFLTNSLLFPSVHLLKNFPTKLNNFRSSLRIWSSSRIARFLSRSSYSEAPSLFPWSHTQFVVISDELINEYIYFLHPSGNHREKNIFFFVECGFNSTSNLFLQQFQLPSVVPGIPLYCGVSFFRIIASNNPVWWSCERGIRRSVFEGGDILFRFRIWVFE